MGAALGIGGVGAATEAHAAPGPFPQWCPGDFWDPLWGDNWDGGACHDNWRGPGPNPHPDAQWGRGGPGDRGGFDNHGGFSDHGGFNGPGDHGGPGGDHGGPGGDHGGPGGPGRR